MVLLTPMVYVSRFSGGSTTIESGTGLHLRVVVLSHLVTGAALTLF